MRARPLLARLAFTALLALTGAPLVPLAFGQETSDAGPDYRKLAQDFARRSAKLQGLLDEIPRASFDTKAIVAEVGTDPKTLCDWVASETRWVPYRGVLRGPKGVLMDRRGSALDRCLLLYELLDLAGHEPRLHRGPLAEGTVDALFETLLALDLGGTDPGSAAQPSPESLRHTARSLGFDAADLRRELLARQSTAQRAAERGITRTLAQSKSLAAFVDLEAAVDARLAERIEAKAMLTDHWWVSLDLEGASMILDPLVETIAVDLDAVRTATDTFSGVLEEELPDDLFHTLRVEFIVERLDGTSFERSVVLTHTLRPHTIIGRSLELSCASVPIVEPSGEGTPEEQAARVRAALLAADEWLPMISVDGSAIKTNSFRADGTLNPRPQTGIGKKLEGVANAISDLGKTPQKSTSHAVALYVRYAATRPGADGPQTKAAERTIFDVLGPADRERIIASGAAVTELDEHTRLQRALVAAFRSDAAPLVCRPSEAYLHGLQCAATIENRDAIIATLLARADVDEAASMTKILASIKKLRSRPVAQYTWGQLRTAYSGLDDSVFLDQINLISRFQTMRSERDDGASHVRGTVGYDVALNGIGVAHSVSEEPRSAALVRLQQGVADTVLEATLLSVELPAGEIPVNTSLAFAASDGEWARAVTPPSGAPANVVTDFERGLAVAAPDQARFRSYWRIDPATGACVGVGPEGRGQVTAETVIVIRLVAVVALSVFCVARQETGGATLTETVSCLEKAVCLALGTIAAALTLAPPVVVIVGAACNAFIS